jgi:hypothetical protein
MAFSSSNQTQLGKPPELALEAAKTMLLATVVGVLIPGVGHKVGLLGSLIGFAVFIASYLFAMWLLEGVNAR